MKKHIVTVAMYAVLAAMAVGCQKEAYENPIRTDEVYSLYTVTYTIDGQPHSEVLVGEQEWLLFLHRMVALAKEGHTVSFKYEGNDTMPSQKDVVTYTTTDENDAVAWCNRMTKDGYSVTLSYDRETHIYTCIAIS